MGKTTAINKEQLANKMAQTIDPRKLAGEKLVAYIEYCDGVLNTAKIAIGSLDMGVAESITFESPSGDGYGMDNRVIDFGYDGPMDICEAIQYMIALRAVANGDIDPSKL